MRGALAPFAPRDFSLLTANVGGKLSSRSIKRCMREVYANGMAAESTGALSASLKFEAAAARWEETGKLQRWDIIPYEFLKLSCWLRSKGAQVDGVSERLERYCDAVRAHLDSNGDPNWYENLLNMRDWCRCGETFRLENLSVCTHCETTLGYCCYRTSSGGTAANGNPKCPICKNGEMVG